MAKYRIHFSEDRRRNGRGGGMPRETGRVQYRNDR